MDGFNLIQTCKSQKTALLNAFDNDQNKNTFFPIPVTSLAEINKKGKLIALKLPSHTQLTLNLKDGLYCNCYKTSELWSSLTCICVSDLLIKSTIQIYHVFVVKNCCYNLTVLMFSNKGRCCIWWQGLITERNVIQSISNYVNKIRELNARRKTSYFLLRVSFFKLIFLLQLKFLFRVFSRYLWHCSGRKSIVHT
jgi:hypothetical protein